MLKIYLTGSNGFVGKNLLKYFRDKYTFVNYVKGSEIELKEQQVVIHLAGKAHDLKNVSKPQEYYKINTELTIALFNAFLASDAKIFITLSSVKASADQVVGVLTEDQPPQPTTHYGKSKLLAEQYILSKQIPFGKRVYILRPSMIHGPGNKGNLNILYKIVSKGFPWPLGAYDNKRSFCSIENLLFIINELIERDDIPNGIYNVADDAPISTNKIISLIADSINIKIRILNIPKFFILFFAKIGDFLKLPFNSERLIKLTENYIVSNKKINAALGKRLPINSEIGLTNTLNSFK